MSTGGGWYTRNLRKEPVLPSEDDDKIDQAPLGELYIPLKSVMSIFTAKNRLEAEEGPKIL